MTGDIEMSLRNGDASFRQCYMKYLQQYRKILLKSHGPSSANCLASAYADFGKDRNGKLLICTGQIKESMYNQQRSQDESPIINQQLLSLLDSTQDS